MQNHHYGISPERMQANQELAKFFKILTTSVDKYNKVYVSTVQAYNYHVTAFQWHPEKNAFEWGPKAIPHTEDAIRVTQQATNFFIRSILFTCMIVYVTNFIVKQVLEFH